MFALPMSHPVATAVMSCCAGAAALAIAYCCAGVVAVAGVDAAAASGCDAPRRSRR